MDYVQLLEKAAHLVESLLKKIHVVAAGMMLVPPATFESFLHHLHWYASIGIAAHATILLVRYVLCKITKARSVDGAARKKKK